MRICSLLVLGCLVTALDVNATTISFEITNLGLNSSGEMVYQYTYTVSGLTLQNNQNGFQELDLLFDPTVFNTLSNPAAPSSLQTFLAQPNNPPGSPGDFGLIPVSDNTVVTGPFSVDFTLLDSAVAGSQPFTVTQFNRNGVAVEVLERGTTVSPVITPEPVVLSLTGIGLLLGTIGAVARRRSARSAN